MKLLSPSILSADFSNLADEVRAVERAGADSIHVDIMDGVFVPNITVGSSVVEAVSKSTSLPVDVHLMIASPDLYIKDFALAGAKSISVHQEACIHLHRTIQLIINEGVKVGVAINPSTSLEQVKWILEEIDFVLVMSVNPGFGGQSFINTTLRKVSTLRLMVENMGLNTKIQVDGGININTIGKISRAGANIFVAGSAIFHSDDYTKAISSLRSKL